MNQLPAISLRLGGHVQRFEHIGGGWPRPRQQGKRQRSAGIAARHDVRGREGMREIDALKGLPATRRSPFHKTVLLLSNGLTRPPDQLEYWDSMIRAGHRRRRHFLRDRRLIGIWIPSAFFGAASAHCSTAMLSYAASLSAAAGPATRHRSAYPPQRQRRPSAPRARHAERWNSRIRTTM